MGHRETCMFCDDIIREDNYNSVENEKNVLSANFLNLIWDVVNDFIVCSDCTTTLQMFCNFKSACMDTEEILLSSINYKKNTKVNLLKVYSERNENLKIKENEKVCRFCFILAENQCLTDLYEKEEYMFIVRMLSKHIPEINLFLTDLIGCKECLDLLETMHHFALKCLIVNDEIKLEREDSTLTDSGSMQETEPPIVKSESCESNTEETSYEISNLIEEADLKTENYMVEDVDMKIHSEEISALERSISNSLSTTVVFTESKHTGRLVTRKRGFRLKKCKSRSKKHLYTPPQKVKCPFCPYEAEHRSYLNRHLFFSHKDQSKNKRVKCSYCSHEATCDTYLRRHMEIHKSLSTKVKEGSFLPQRTHTLYN